MPDDMLVEVGDAVIPDRNLGKEGHGPAVARAEDDVVDVGDGLAIDEVDGAGLGADARNGRVVLDARVLEGLVAEVAVEVVADGDGVHGGLGGARVGEVVGDVGGGDGCAYYYDFLLGG